MNGDFESSVAVIIPSFNRREITVACIRNLNVSCSKLFRIFVCDSGSSDGTPEAVKVESQVTLIHAGSSAWWSAAVNSGVRAALKEGFRVFLILNDDISFEGDVVGKMLQGHQQHPDCILTPIQKTALGRFAGIRYRGVKKRIEYLLSDEDGAVVDSSNGCCLLIPATVFERAGLFDEARCPQLYGDTEFQLRAARSGFPTVVVGAVTITQLGNSNYFARLNLGSIFTFEGSPLHWLAYFAFGTQLYRGRLRFLFLGYAHHTMYLKTLLKALVAIAHRLRASEPSS
jgi:GT2 family glycosyltransferase